MKHTRMKRLLSLLLAMAMALSMVSGAFAVGPESIAVEAETTQADDALSFDGDQMIVVDPDAEESDILSEEETEDAEESAEEMEEVSEETPIEEVKEEEPAEETEAEADAEESIMEEPAEEEEASTELDTEAGTDVEVKWTAQDGVYSLTVGGTAAQGYYDLPEMKDGSITYTAGLYYFTTGNWDSAQNGGSVSVADVNVITASSAGRYHSELKKKLAVVVDTPTVTNENGVVTIRSNSSLFSGETGSIDENNLTYYYRGERYSGFFRTKDADTSFMQVVENGTPVGMYTGTLNDKGYENLTYIAGYQVKDKKQETRFFINGHTKGYYHAEDGLLYLVTAGVIAAKPFTGVLSEKMGIASRGIAPRTYATALYYLEGVPFTGYYFNSKSVLYKFADGKNGGKFTGKLGSKQEVWDVSGETVNYHSTAYKSRRFMRGQLYTGVYTDRYYYKSGKKQAVENKTWLKVKSGNIYLLYYFKTDSNDNKVKAVTGWQYITRSGVKYKYYFRKTDEKNPCSVVTDMFSYNSAYKSKKLQIRVSRTADVCTILAYDSKTDSYCIPCKSFVVSMASKVENMPAGTYGLRKKSGWHPFTYDDGSTNYFLYPTGIQGSHALFHSANFIKKDRESMICTSYNNLGHNNTAYCVRSQMVNCKLIYNLVRQNSSTKVIVTTSSKVKQYQPFGKVTLSYNFDYVGKLYAGKSGKDRSVLQWDPTDTAVKKTPKMQ